MHLSLDDFCDVVKKSNRSNAEKELAVLWYFDHERPDIPKTAGQLTKILGDHHIGTPNQTALAEAIRKTKLANESKSGFSLKPGSRKVSALQGPYSSTGSPPSRFTSAITSSFAASS